MTVWAEFESVLRAVVLKWNMQDEALQFLEQRYRQAPISDRKEFGALRQILGMLQQPLVREFAGKTVDRTYEVRLDHPAALWVGVRIYAIPSVGRSPVELVLFNLQPDTPVVVGYEVIHDIAVALQNNIKDLVPGSPLWNDLYHQTREATILVGEGIQVQCSPELSAHQFHVKEIDREMVSLRFFRNPLSAFRQQYQERVFPLVQAGRMNVQSLP